MSDFTNGMVVMLVMFVLVLGGIAIGNQKQDFTTLDTCVDIVNEAGYDINDTEGRAKFLQGCVDN